MHTRILGAALAAAAFLTVAAPSGAATVTYDAAGTLTYTAGPGERNNLSIQFPEAGRITLYDGTGVTASGPADRCANSYDSVITCDAPTALQVVLGDGDDRAVVSSEAPSGFAVRIAGGDGNDQLEGDYTGAVPATLVGDAGDDQLKGGAAADVLDGGAGNDHLEGSAGPDRLDGGAGDDVLSGDGYKSPSADVLDGGAGIDTISTEWSESSYADGRPAPLVAVTLAGGADDGRPGEGDDVRNVERLDVYASGSFTGTEAADHIAINRQSVASTVRGLGGDDDIVASEGDDTIDGGTGADRIDAGFGDDRVVGGPGRDRIFGDHPGGDCGPLWCRNPYGNDTIEARDGEIDQIDCGPGQDRVVADAVDVVGTDCETVDRAAGTPTVPRPLGSVKVAARAGALRAALRSGIAVTVTAPAAGRVRVQAFRGTRLVGTTTGRALRAGRVTLTLRPSAAGRRELARPGRLRLTLTATFTPTRGTARSARSVVTLSR